MRWVGLGWVVLDGLDSIKLDWSLGWGWLGLAASWLKAGWHWLGLVGVAGAGWGQGAGQPI